LISKDRLCFRRSSNIYFSHFPASIFGINRFEQEVVACNNAPRCTKGRRGLENDSVVSENDRTKQTVHVAREKAFGVFLAKIENCPLLLLPPHSPPLTQKSLVRVPSHFREAKGNHRLKK